MKPAARLARTNAVMTVTLNQRAGPRRFTGVRGESWDISGFDAVSLSRVPRLAADTVAEPTIVGSEDHLEVTWRPWLTKAPIRSCTRAGRSRSGRPTAPVTSPDPTSTS